MIKDSNTRFLVTLPDEYIAKLDARAAEIGVSRSTLVGLILMGYEPKIAPAYIDLINMDTLAQDIDPSAPAPEPVKRPIWTKGMEDYFKRGFLRVE